MGISATKEMTSDANPIGIPRHPATAEWGRAEQPQLLIPFPLLGAFNDPSYQHTHRLRDELANDEDANTSLPTSAPEGRNAHVPTRQR